MHRVFALVLAAAIAAGAAQAEEVGAVSYQFKWLGPNDKIKVEAFDDPEVPGVACYVSRAETGGMKGAVGLAEDPGELSIACRQVGPIDLEKARRVKNGEQVFARGASWLFKKSQVVRFYDAKRNVLVYLTYTDKIIEGSPRNAISVVPLSR